MSFVPAGSGVNIKVGRWMSPAEYQQMVTTGKAIESTTNSGYRSCYVTCPANPNSFKPQNIGDVYIEFEVPTTTTMYQGGQIDWKIIPGNNSNFNKLPSRVGMPLYEMPNVTNISLQKINN